MRPPPIRWVRKMEEPPKAGETARAICVHETCTIYVTPGPHQDTDLQHEILHACLPRASEAQISMIEKALYGGKVGLLGIGQP